MNAIEFYYDNIYSHFKRIEDVTDSFLKEAFYKATSNQILDYFDISTSNDWKVKFIKY